MINTPKNVWPLSVTLNVPKILSNCQEIPLIGKKSSNIVDVLKNKTLKFTKQKIFPLKTDQVDEDMSMNWIKDTINRPVPPRRTILLRPSGFIDNDQERESFHCSMGRLLLVAQFLGILPLGGVNSKSPKDLVFKIFHLRTIWVVVILSSFGVMVSSTIGNLIQSYHMSAGKFYASESFGVGLWVLIFYSDAFLSLTFFIWLAPHWKRIQQEWRAMEQLLDRRNHQPTRLRSKFTVITTVITIVALVEHVMGLLAGPPFDLLNSSSNFTFNDVIHSICKASHPYLLTIVEYNWVSGIAILTINTVAGFAWNFVDIFVILVSVGLVERYKTLNKKLADEISSCSNNIDWNEFRQCFATLSKLVKNVDHHISSLILLSFFNNVYFSCLQLLKTFSDAPTSIRIYYFGSFLFVIIRTTAVTLIAGQIYIQSKNALSDVYICPESAYNGEAQRLQLQLSSDEVYLTGMKFFPITRNFMLAIVGTIVTYVVLLLNSIP